MATLREWREIQEDIQIVQTNGITLTIRLEFMKRPLQASLLSMGMDSLSNTTQRVSYMYIYIPTNMTNCVKRSKRSNNPYTALLSTIHFNFQLWSSRLNV